MWQISSGHSNIPHTPKTLVYSYSTRCVKESQSKKYLHYLHASNLGEIQALRKQQSTSEQNDSNRT